MGKPGAAFERLAAAVQAKLAPDATVTWNERINGRQIDVAIRGVLGSARVLVVAECRDYATKLGIEHIDAFASVASDVGANKAILVTRTGFSQDAVEKAARIGIDTCVLRRAVDDDVPGAAVLLDSIQLTVELRGTNIDNLEVELADGRRLPCGLFYKVRDKDGNEEFLDRIIKSWLATDGRHHVDGEPLHLSLEPPPVLLWDREQPAVTRLHCVPRESRGPSIVSLWQAPEQWVFLQIKPGGSEDEGRFFSFPDLAARAEMFLPPNQATSSS